MKIRKISLILIALLFLIACSDDASTEEVEVDEDLDNRFVRFQYLEVVTEETNVLFTGDVTTSEEVIYYTITQDDEVLIEEQTLVLEESGEEWIPFEIKETLPTEVSLTSDVPPIISIYGKTENGTEINPNYIPVDMHME